MHDTRGIAVIAAFLVLGTIHHSTHLRPGYCTRHRSHTNRRLAVDKGIRTYLKLLNKSRTTCFKGSSGFIITVTADVITPRGQERLANDIVWHTRSFSAAIQFSSITLRRLSSLSFLKVSTSVFNCSCVGRYN